MTPLTAAFVRTLHCAFVILFFLVIVQGVAAEGFEKVDPNVYRWGNAVYVDLEVGGAYSFLGKTVKLVSIENNFCTVEVEGERRQLIVARRALPEVVGGVRLFVADNRHVAALTTNEKNRNVHAALTKDALLCLSDPAGPLLDPKEYTFPISREDGFRWTMHENSHMFAYLRPVRAHEGIDIDLSDARGLNRHAILAPEDGTVRGIVNTAGSDVEARLFIQSDNDPELTYSYSHLNRNKIFVRPGQHVRRGQKIGYIWGDWRWGHLHFAVRKYEYDGGEIEYSGFKYLLNAFPQMYELYHGDLKLRRKVWTNGDFRFGGQYWTNGNRQFLDQYDDLVGYGWRLGTWCTPGKVERSLPDEGGKPDQSARLRKIMHTNTKQPATNPNDYCDFEIAVANGRYMVASKIGDRYARTWQRMEFEGVAAGEYDLDHELEWTPTRYATVKDGHLTVRIHLRDAQTPAGIYQFQFSIVAPE